MNGNLLSSGRPDDVYFQLSDLTIETINNVDWYTINLGQEINAPGTAELYIALDKLQLAYSSSAGNTTTWKQYPQLATNFATPQPLIYYAAVNDVAHNLANVYKFTLTPTNNASLLIAPWMMAYYANSIIMQDFGPTSNNQIIGTTLQSLFDFSSLTYQFTTQSVPNFLTNADYYAGILATKVFTNSYVLISSTPINQMCYAPATPYIGETAIYLSPWLEIGPNIRRQMETKTNQLLLAQEQDLTSTTMNSGYNFFMQFRPTDVQIWSYYVNYMWLARTTPNPVWALLGAPSTTQNLMVSISTSTLDANVAHELFSYAVGLCPIAGGTPNRSVGATQTFRNNPGGCIPDYVNEPRTHLYMPSSVSNAVKCCVFNFNTGSPYLLYNPTNLPGMGFLPTAIQTNTNGSIDPLMQRVPLQDLNLLATSPLYLSTCPWRKLINLQGWQSMYNDNPIGYSSAGYAKLIINQDFATTPDLGMVTGIFENQDITSVQLSSMTTSSSTWPMYMRNIGCPYAQAQDGINQWNVEYPFWNWMHIQQVSWSEFGINSFGQNGIHQGPSRLNPTVSYYYPMTQIGLTSPDTYSASRLIYPLATPLTTQANYVNTTLSQPLWGSKTSTSPLVAAYNNRPLIISDMGTSLVPNSNQIYVPYAYLQLTTSLQYLYQGQNTQGFPAAFVTYDDSLVDYTLPVMDPNFFTNLNPNPSGNTIQFGVYDYSFLWSWFTKYGCQRWEYHPLVYYANTTPTAPFPTYDNNNVGTYKTTDITTAINGGLPLGNATIFGGVSLYNAYPIQNVTAGMRLLRNDFGVVTNTPANITPSTFDRLNWINGTLGTLSGTVAAVTPSNFMSTYSSFMFVTPYHSDNLRANAYWNNQPFQNTANNRMGRPCFNVPAAIYTNVTSLPTAGSYITCNAQAAIAFPMFFPTASQNPVACQRDYVLFAFSDSPSLTPYNLLDNTFGNTTLAWGNYQISPNLNNSTTYPLGTAIPGINVNDFNPYWNDPDNDISSWIELYNNQNNIYQGNSSSYGPYSDNMLFLTLSEGVNAPFVHSMAGSYLYRGAISPHIYYHRSRAAKVGENSQMYCALQYADNIRSKGFNAYSKSPHPHFAHSGLNLCFPVNTQLTNATSFDASKVWNMDMPPSNVLTNPLNFLSDNTNPPTFNNCRDVSGLGPRGYNYVAQTLTGGTVPTQVAAIRAATYSILDNYITANGTYTAVEIECLETQADPFCGRPVIGSTMNTGTPAQNTNATLFDTVSNFFWGTAASFSGLIDCTDQRINYYKVQNVPTNNVSSLHRGLNKIHFRITENREQLDESIVQQLIGRFRFSINYQNDGSKSQRPGHERGEKRAKYVK
jgi:hypothetical protein